MQESLEHSPAKSMRAKRWIASAIAATLLGIAGWQLPNRRLQPGQSHQPQETATLTYSQQAADELGLIAVMAGGVFWLLYLCTGQRKEAIDLSRTDLCGADFNGADFNRANFRDANLSDANLSNSDLRGANLSGANLSGANLSGTDLNGADLIGANLSGATLNDAELRYANLSGANLRYANLSGANLSGANLSGTDLNCALVVDANFSDANLSEALLLFINSRRTLNLEPSQLKVQPSPFLCNVALPAYGQQPPLNPNRDCARMPQVLSDRYNIPLEEARGIVDEARQYRWD